VSTPTWAEFAGALARELARLGDGMFLVLNERDRPWHLAQFQQGLSELRAEVSGETADAEGNQQETPRGRRLIESLGWRPPATYDVNWWRELKWPALSSEYRELAEAVVAVLRDVNGIESPERLTYRAWESAKGNRPWAVDLPGVAPEPR
jgi:hypothetical protein